MSRRRRNPNKQLLYYTFDGIQDVPKQDGSGALNIAIISIHDRGRLLQSFGYALNHQSTCCC